MTPQHPRPISLGKTLLGVAILGLLASGYLTGSPGASAVLQGQQAPVLQILTFNPSSGEFVGQPVETPIMSNGQPSFGTSTALTVHPDGYVYIPNRSTNTIAVFTASGEQLGEPVPNASGANGPNGATIGPEGNCLYVTNQATSNVSTFRIQDDGRLEPGPGPFLTFGNNASQNASGAILVSRDDQRVYVSNVRSGDVTVFRRGEGCELTLVQGSPFSTRAGSNAFPLGMGEAVVNGQTYLYVSNHVPGSITRFRVADDGVLTAVGQPIQKGELTRNDRIAITEDSRFLYVSNLRGQGGISAFRIGSDGGLTPLDGSPFNTGRLFTDLDFGPNEEFLIGYTPSPAINQQATLEEGGHDTPFRLSVEGESGKRILAIGANGALDPVGSASVLTAFSESDDALDCRIFHVGNTDEVPDASGSSGDLPACPQSSTPQSCECEEAEVDVKRPDPGDLDLKGSRFEISNIPVELNITCKGPRNKSCEERFLVEMTERTIEFCSWPDDPVTGDINCLNVTDIQKDEKFNGGKIQCKGTCAPEGRSNSQAESASYSVTFLNGIPDEVDFLRLRMTVAVSNNPARTQCQASDEEEFFAVYDIDSGGTAVGEPR